MRHKLAIAPALVAALTLGALTVHTTGSPAGAAAAPATWDLEAYGPRPTDNVVLKWNEQLLETIRRPTRRPPARRSPRGRSASCRPPSTTRGPRTTPVAKGTRLGGSAAPARRRARPMANKSKAISYAAYRVLTDLFPSLPQQPTAGVRATR